MVVFASNKNRRVPGAPLHTNFKLGASGDYLALVMPDGVTKATEFAPAFPPQYADISYGYAMTGAVRTLVAPDAPVRTLVPTSDIDPGWRLAGYDDSNWASGTLGIGYDTSGNYAPAIGTDLGAAMFNVNPSAYLRVPFTVADPYTLTLLTLSLRYDDGFVAYLNGTEVFRRNAPATLAWIFGHQRAPHRDAGGRLRGLVGQLLPPFLWSASLAWHTRRRQQFHRQFSAAALRRGEPSGQCHHLWPDCRRASSVHHR